MTSRLPGWLPYALGSFILALIVLSIALATEEVAAVTAVGLWLAVTTVVGALIAARRGANPIGWILLGIGASGAVGNFAESYVERFQTNVGTSSLSIEFLAWLSKWVRIPGFALFALLFMLFPNGRLPSPHWRWPALAGGVAGVVGFSAVALTPGPIEAVPNIENPVGLETAGPALKLVSRTALQIVGALGLAAIFSLFLRLRRSQGEERQQVKWLVFAGAVLAATLLFTAMSPQATNEASFVLAIAGLLGIPVAIGIAVLKHRLYDIDLVINRALVYAVLTIGVAALYVIIVGAMGALFQQRVGLGASLIATGVVAVVFQPLRSRLQRIIDRLMFGDRADPYTALSRLGRQLEAAFAPEEVLPTTVETVSSSLKLPFVAIDLNRDDHFERAASVGLAVADPTVVPLVYQGATVGRLIVGRRAGETELSEADRRIIEDLARQAGVAAYAVGLTAALQKSHRELVAAREEERRRLRRDLHDGVGPELAGVVLGLGAARNLLGTKPSDVDEVIARLETQAEEAIATIRTIVEDLRPPALDELGLIAALREKALLFEGDQGHPGLDVSVEAPDELPPLSAAVEVAVFRIALEALTNSARHSRARRCWLRLHAEHDLVVEIEDDGAGLVEGARQGVGLASMRQRAGEVGGTFNIQPGSRRGTLVRVRLPLQTS
jgi:two-component system, NarL family, sensor kinase